MRGSHVAEDGRRRDFRSARLYSVFKLHARVRCRSICKEKSYTNSFASFAPLLWVKWEPSIKLGVRTSLGCDGRIVDAECGPIFSKCAPILSFLAVSTGEVSFCSQGKELQEPVCPFCSLLLDEMGASPSVKLGVRRHRWLSRAWAGILSARLYSVFEQ